jgi:hypothetical protein
MKKRAQLSRRGKFREPRKLVLIVCEGESTEPKYLDEFRKVKKLSATEIEIVKSRDCGTDPQGIVKYAKAKRKKKRDEGLEYDSVWCVFDRDSHDRYKNAIIEARDNRINLAISNPCFELWLLLHYKLQTATIHRKKAEKELKRYIPHYEKGIDGIYHIILAYQRIAIERSEQLRHLHRCNNCDEKENPSTTMDHLVIYLNTIGEEN